jgi:septum formation inhibitor MinC
VRIVVSKALVDAAKHEGISALEVMEDDTDAMGDPEALFMALTLKYNGKNGNADLFNLFAETKLTATEEAETMSGWRIESTLREFRKPKNTVCWFRWPVHVDDFTGMLKDALAYGELPVKLVKTEAQKQKEAEEKEERQRKKKEENAAKKAEQRLAMANDKNSHVNVMKAKEQEAAEALLVASIIRCGGEGVATLADVGRMLERSPRSVRRIVEEAGYAVENCVITTSRKEYAL